MLFFYTTVRFGGWEGNKKPEKPEDLSVLNLIRSFREKKLREFNAFLIFYPQLPLIV